MLKSYHHGCRCCRGVSVHSFNYIGTLSSRSAREWISASLSPYVNLGARDIHMYMHMSVYVCVHIAWMRVHPCVSVRAPVQSRRGSYGEVSCVLVLFVRSCEGVVGRTGGESSSKRLEGSCGKQSRPPKSSTSRLRPSGPLENRFALTEVINPPQFLPSSPNALHGSICLSLLVSRLDRLWG